MWPANLAGARRALGAAAIVAIGSCAHDGRPHGRARAAPAPAAQRPTAAPSTGPESPAPLNKRAMMSIGDTRYDTWIAQVRECTAEDAARAQPHLPGPQAELAKRKPAVSIVGRLVPTAGDCTLMECGDGCCNQCDFRWVVVPRDCPGRTLGVSARESPTSMSGCAMACALNGYLAEADWVIVSGRIGGQGDVVVDADFCLLRSLAMIEAKNQLTDADYERLASPGSKRPPDDARCPPR